MLFALAWIPLTRSRDAWLHGNDAAAIAGGEQWSRLHLWPSQYHQLLAAAYLHLRQHVRGARALQRHSATSACRSSRRTKSARRLFAREHYGDFLAYDAASRDAHENTDVPLYRAAALAATNRVAEAQKAFASIDRSHVNASRYASLLFNLAARGTGGCAVRVPTATAAPLPRFTRTTSWPPTTTLRR